MQFAELTVFNQDITTVYRPLDLSAIDTGSLKGLLGGDTKPMLMDVPDMIVVVYPSVSVVVQIGNNRIITRLERPAENVESLPLWEVATKCHQLASEFTLVAYGFNYHMSVSLEAGNADRDMIELFVCDPRGLESVIGGELLSFKPRFRFQRDETIYHLEFEPKDEKDIMVHFNVHFERKGLIFPPQTELGASFVEEFGYLMEMLPNVLEGSE